MMKNLRKHVSVFAFILVAAMAFTLIPSTKTEATTKKNHSYTGVDYVLKVGKTKQLPKKSGVKWFSDNKKVATVNQKGKVTAKSGGTAVITATTASGYKYYYEIGVKSKKYYPNVDGKMKVGKDIPAGQYVLIGDTKCSSTGAYWEIKTSEGSSFESDAFSYTAIVTVTKGQTLEYNGCYAVPFKYTPKSMFSVKKINKNLGYDGASVKVGYGFPAGTYTFTLKKGCTLGYVNVADHDPSTTKHSYFGTDYSTYETLKESNNSITVTLKKGEYLEVVNCTIKKVK